ncbi:MAG: hypothetical protein ACYCWA_00305 [Thiobacillus sp.]
MEKLIRHWPAATLAAALLLALLAAQVSIFNTEPMPPGELDARLAQLQAAREGRLQ